MKLNKTVIPIVTVICIIVLALSFFLWKTKLQNVRDSVHKVHPTKIETSSETKPTSETSNKEEVKSGLTAETLKASIANADPSVQKLLVNRFEQNDKVQMLIVGSNAMNEGNPGYAEQLSTALANTYGDFIEVTIVSKDVTSDNFVNKEMANIDWSKQFDLVLLEPFTLKNNGIVAIEDEHKHIEAIISQVKGTVEDAVIVLQPSYPLFNAKYYLSQIQALGKYATAKKIPYINHWTAWPETTDEKLKNYLTTEKNPNSEGAKVWSSALTKYFTGK